MKTNIRTFLTCPLSPGIVLTVQTLGPKHPNALDGKLLLAECCLDLGRIKDWKLSTFATHVFPADHFPSRSLHLQEASAAARFSFRVRRRNFGPRHPRTLSAAVILAAACAKRRRTRQAVIWKDSEMPC